MALRFDRTLNYRYLEFYYSLGLNPIPLRFGDKPPLIRWQDYQTKKSDIGLFDQFKTFNIGVMCGVTSSNLVVLDFDTRAGPPVKDTLVSETGRGAHIWYIFDSLPCTMKRSGLDIKANGYVVAPPSLHPSGKIYHFTVNPGGIRRADRLETIMKEIGVTLPRNLEKPFTFKPGQNANKLNPRTPQWVRRLEYGTVPEGHRNEMAIRRACILTGAPPYGKGYVDASMVLELMRAWNKRVCKPPLPDHEIREAVKHAFQGHYVYLRDPYS